MVADVFKAVLRANRLRRYKIPSGRGCGVPGENHFHANALRRREKLKGVVIFGLGGGLLRDIQAVEALLLGDKVVDLGDGINKAILLRLPGGFVGLAGFEVVFAESGG